jgi:hypothetical protein
MGVLVSLSYGCHPLDPLDTLEEPVQQSSGTGEVKEPEAVVPRPNIRSNNPRFYHENQASRVSIRYKNSGLSQAYRVQTNLAGFLDGYSVPIEVDNSIVSTLAPNEALEFRGTLPDAFFSGVMDGKGKFRIEFTAHYQDEHGKEFEAFSVWQFSRSTMELFLLEDRANSRRSNK